MLRTYLDNHNLIGTCTSYFLLIIIVLIGAFIRTVNTCENLEARNNQENTEHKAPILCFIVVKCGSFISLYTKATVFLDSTAARIILEGNTHFHMQIWSKYVRYDIIVDKPVSHMSRRSLCFR